MSRSRIVLAARHAPVVVQGTCYGRTDVASLVAAEVAAAQLIASHDGEPPRVVWSSPLSRCLSVATLLTAHFGAALRVDERLHELDFGAWDGRTWTEISRDDGVRYARWLERWQDVAPPGGELPRDLEQRVRAWYDALDDGATHALIAHAGVVRALRVVTEGCAWIDAMRGPVEHLAWVRFSERDEARNQTGFENAVDIASP